MIDDVIFVYLYRAEDKIRFMCPISLNKNRNNNLVFPYNQKKTNKAFAATISPWLDKGRLLGRG